MLVGRPLWVCSCWNRCGTTAMSRFGRPGRGFEEAARGSWRLVPQPGLHSVIERDCGAMEAMILVIPGDPPLVAAYIPMDELPLAPCTRKATSTTNRCGTAPTSTSARRTPSAGRFPWKPSDVWSAAFRKTRGRARRPQPTRSGAPGTRRAGSACGRRSIPGFRGRAGSIGDPRRRRRLSMQPRRPGNTG